MKINKLSAIILFFIALAALCIFSYAYVDPHLSKLLPYIAYYHRREASVIFFILLSTISGYYVYFLKHHPKVWVIIAAAAIMVLSYPATTYDLFNYITTAKVLYTYHENPYLVMPIEIPNEPNLAFTRAANKVALYGPVWLGITAIPHYLGGNNIWQTILAFKLVTGLVYLGFCYVIWRVTKNGANVVFFALNPLILIEVLMNGHNDIYMMILALGALALWQRSDLKNKVTAAFLLFASFWIKGATVVLTPLLFFKSVINGFVRLLLKSDF
jgi:hypothetical protein